MTWEPAERVQKNATGEYRALIGGEWVPVAKAQKSASGQYRIDRGMTQPVVEPQQEGMMSQLGGAAIATGAGLAKGAADIGATLLTPFDALGLSGYSPDQRRAKLEEFSGNFNRPAFTAGEITSNIAGTAGAGGALAGGVRGLMTKTPKALEKFAVSLETGGLGGSQPFTARLAGGAASGGAMAGMVNPEDAVVGAGIGAALPAGVSAITQGIPKLAGAVAGTTSGVGRAPLSEAFQAGKSGGSKAQAFRQNIEGSTPVNDALNTAKSALDQMRQARSAQYKATIGDSFENADNLDFTPIEQELNKALSTVKGKGSSVLQEVSPETTIWVDKFGQRVQVPETVKPPKLDNLVSDVKKYGGINISYAREFGLTPQEAARSGLFTKNGKGLDEISRHVEQKGWVGEHTLADADYRATGGREGYVKDMIESALADKTNIIHPSQADDWHSYIGAENALREQGINKVTIPAKTKQTSGEYWTIGKDEQGKITEVADIINEWKLDPARHNVEGLDALKRRIGAVYPDNPKQTQAQRVIDTMYNSVKGTIEKQAPKYSETMRGYSNMTDQIREIEKSLSLGNKATADTAMRKLQSLMRNNVQTNYGGRIESAKQLEKFGAGNLMTELAGQSLSELAPRGIARAGNIGGFVAATAMNPLSLAALPIASPRLMGEAAYASGVGARGVNRLADLIGANQVPSGLTQSAILNALNR